MDLIREMEKRALEGLDPDREGLIRLLELDPESEEAEELGRAARRVASVVTGERARIWASIGVDYQPCAMNCSFCSFGEAWDALGSSRTLSRAEVFRLAEENVKQGADWITLRTTEDYGLEELIHLAREIKQKIPGDYDLVANTGNISAGRAERLYNEGFRIVYHSIRMGEGLDTPFSTKERCHTLEQIRQSPLQLAFLAEPVGVEHTSAEIADVFLTAMEYGASLSGAMARIPVPGTPKYPLGQISDRRLAQIVAVTRLGAGHRAPDICVHPPSRTALEWGANVVVVDLGALPRSAEMSVGAWNGFDVSTARQWFLDAGYRVKELEDQPDPHSDSMA